jgi:type I restriction enzyme S subunit
MSELPTGWAKTTLGELAPLKYGKALGEKDRASDGPVPVFGSSGLIGQHDRALTTAETLIVGRKGNVGHVYHSSHPCWVIDTAYFVDGFQWLNWRFLYYLLTHENLSQLDRSTAIPGISRDDYNAVEVSIAPPAEQNRIVSEIEKQFTRLDAATAALKRVQANLKRYRASVLKAACEGRLVPTEAEVARKEGRDYEPAAQLLQRILRERRARWEADTLARMIASGKPPKDDGWKQRYKEPSAPDTSNLPALPEGWCWSTLGQMTSLITSGSRGWGDLYSESGPLFIRAQDIKTDSLILQNVAHVQLTEDSEGTRARVQASDLLVTITGANVTKAALVGIELEEAYVSQHVGLVRPVLSETAHHLYTWITSPMQGRAELLRLAYGAGKPGLNLDNLRELCIALGPVTEQQRIQAEISRMLSSADSLDSTLETSARRGSGLRRSILQNAFTGKLVPQEQSDEPASVLLERIRAERASKPKASARTKREEPVYA